MRKYIFVTKVFGNVPIQARTRDEANDEFQRRGYDMSNIEEVR